ncbi:MAG TPA: leucyl/phenylalanyl-tRNA--protein transferase [Pyrinomonadaceae bacterium]|jgi:leucyl/phenylalanyl-tRNA--protein transferase|nr:leucyl/phenylalanyl-tRNA--protein transferase [Pyrinomonadaceae bacterium]
MPVASFPDPRDASPEGLVAVGGDLHPSTLLLAYGQGIFPWPTEGYPLLWFSPPERAILEFKDLHVPRRLARTQRQQPFRYTIDASFESVVRACAHAARPEQDGTWITSEMIRAYCEFHRRGHAHSVEAWEGDALVGGLYGVDAGGAFAGESMFYLRPNASKLALLHLVRHLAARGLDWIDIQMLTPHMRVLGAKNISRDDFLQRLAATRARQLTLF